jgi:hypothetical protein
MRIMSENIKKWIDWEAIANEPPKLRENTPDDVKGTSKNYCLDSKYHPYSFFYIPIKNYVNKSKTNKVFFLHILILLLPSRYPFAFDSIK